MTPSTEDAQMSVNDILAKAELAQTQGVPVDWKQVAYLIYNSASNYISLMEQEQSRQREFMDLCLTWLTDESKPTIDRLNTVIAGLKAELPEVEQPAGANGPAEPTFDGGEGDR